MKTAAEKFSDQIIAEILSLCTQPQTEYHIFNNMDGCDPFLIHDTIEKLLSENILRFSNGYYQCTRIKKTDSHVLKVNQKKDINILPISIKPHPLDFEWRNSTRALKSTACMIEEDELNKEPILILGMPSLYAYLKKYIKCKKVLLIDKNTPIVHELKNDPVEGFDVILSDISTYKIENDDKFFTVFMDPPWYTKSFQDFVSLATNMTILKGHMFITVPPSNTRYGIADERQEWISYCNDLGWENLTITVQNQEYVMPFFEWNALRAKGIRNISPFWRKGDQIKLVKKKDVKSKILRVNQAQNDHNTWIEVILDQVRVRVKISLIEEEKCKKECLPEEIISGGVLDSISSQDKRREKVNIWTSGNRVFMSENPKMFLDFLTIYSIDNSYYDIPNDLYSFITDLISKEKKDYNNYIKWIAHEMEKRYP